MSNYMFTFIYSDGGFIAENFKLFATISFF